MKKLSLFFVLFILTAFTAKSQYTDMFDFAGVSNGKMPYSDFYYDGTFLYSTTSYGGAGNFGTIFKIKPDGSGFTKLFDFANTNGQLPYGTLISVGAFLYGTASSGGNHGYGVVFKIKTDGSGYDTIFNFNNTDGGDPSGTLVYDGTFLYGLTSQGGTNNMGTIFKMKTDGSGFASILSFNFTNGENPESSLIYDGTFLYGTAANGGANAKGVIFKIKPDGSNYTDLLDFAGVSNGSAPFDALISDGTFLYGTTYSGGANNLGTLFKIKTDGSGFLKLLDFAGATNGEYPYGSIVYDGTFLYGTAYFGGANNKGTLYEIKPDGSAYSKLFDFDSATGGNPTGTPSIIGQFLYGTNTALGLNNMGTLYKYDLNPLGIAENKVENKVELYPNPATSNAIISFATDDMRTIELYDITGRKMSMYNSLHKEFTLPCSGFSSGIYFVKVLDTKGGQTIKLIKQ